MTDLEAANWIAVAQVHATLSAGWRTLQWTQGLTLGEREYAEHQADTNEAFTNACLGLSQYVMADSENT